MAFDDILTGADGDVLLGSDGDILLGEGSGPVTSVVGVLSSPGAINPVFSLPNTDGGLFLLDPDGVTVDGPTVSGVYTFVAMVVANGRQATKTFQVQYLAPPPPSDLSDPVPVIF